MRILGDNNRITGNTVVDNSALSRSDGIEILAGANATVITGNTADRNGGSGIFVGGSGGALITGNTARDNGEFDLFMEVPNASACSRTVSGNIGSGNRPIVFLNATETLSATTVSQLILCNADGARIDTVTVAGSETLKNNGIFLLWTDNATIERSVSSDNRVGVVLKNSDRNTLRENTFERNFVTAIELAFFSGIGLQNSSFNTIVHNNVVNNSHPPRVTGGESNLFSLPLPVGGNYWETFGFSGAFCPDEDTNGICDAAFVFDGGRDDFPWTTRDGWKAAATPSLANMRQFKSDGATALAEGNTTTEDTVTFKATLQDAAGHTLRMEVEYTKVSFTGVPNATSTPVASGSVAMATAKNLTDGSYRARARSVDAATNAAGPWVEFGIAGNTDFVVHQVPLYTQVRSPFPSDRLTQVWSAQPYADSIATSTCGATIAQCGCAITSMVMLGRYYGIETGIDSSDVAPNTINSWLSLASTTGYTSGEDLNWGKTIEYLGFKESGKNKSHLALDHHNATATSLIDSYVLFTQPAIVRSERFGHYFVADGKIAPDGISTYTVKDPRWYNTTTLNQTKNIASNIQGYGNSFDKANLFSFSPAARTIAGMIYLYLASPAELLVTDPLGRRLGADPRNGASYGEIPNSSYTEEGPIVSSDEPLDPTTLHQTKVVYIPEPIGGVYGIDVIGTATGTYEFFASVNDADGTTHAQTFRGGTAAGTVTDFTLDFAPTAETTIEAADAISPEALVYFDPTTKKLTVHGSDNITDPAPMVHVSGNTHTITDAAGNSTTLSFKKLKQAGKEIKAEIKSIQYGTSTPVVLSDTDMEIEYALTKQGGIKELEQELSVKNRFTVEAKYEGKKNVTTIKIKQKGREQTKQMLAGLHIIQLLTDNGTIGYRIVPRESLVVETAMRKNISTALVANVLSGVRGWWGGFVKSILRK